MANTALGIVFALIGGALNSSYPLVVSNNAFLRAKGWGLENVYLVWGLFQLVVLYIWVDIIFGWQDFSEVIQLSSSTDVALVCTFSFIWGFGAYTYGLATKLVGPAIGISLILSLVVVIGTLLPLIYDREEIESGGQLGMLLFGVVLALIGFSLIAVAGQLREAFRSRSRTTEKASPKAVSCVIEMDSVKSVENYMDLTNESRLMKDGPIEDKLKKVDESVSLQDDAQIQILDDARNKGDEGEGQQSVPWSVSILVCFISGVTSSMLQFAFVFGEDMIEIAEDVKGKAEAIATLAVWVFAFSLAAAVIMIFSIFLLIKNGSFCFFYKLSPAQFVTNILKCIFMAVAFVGHIQLYGASQAELGDLGPALAWPLLMVSSVCGGQLWSIFLKEWSGTNKRPWNINLCGLLFLLLSGVVIALAGSIEF
eukprot:TRINITY_DN3527_c1_g1_i3.p1 TRINITY_DN3527_c1_g1~~TRINITY_DN3527_c1_g1_i3.p1  ORF type:complete len:438 (+),score=55.28 TRINITY_DN3527_c1_g1_i3:43-1314(+)